MAHSKFGVWLLEEAKKNNLVFKSQVILGNRKEYLEELETLRKSRKGLETFIRL